MTNTIHKILLYGAVIVLVLLFMYLFGVSASRVGASAPNGLQAIVATSSAYSLTTTASTLVATSSGCAARIISTQGSPLMLTFSDLTGQTPTALLGHLQSASTTVAYDSGVYGCGLVKAYSFTTATTTVTETR